MKYIRYIYNLREKILEAFVAQKAKVFHHDAVRKFLSSLFFHEIFWPVPSHVPKKKLSLSQKQECCGVPSDRLSLSLSLRRINQISLHLLSRKSIALFHKGVFIYQNAVISVILLSSRHRRERERAESANTLSLKKRDRGLNPVDHKSTIKERACVCDHHRLAREYISLI